MIAPFFFHYLGYIKIYFVSFFTFDLLIVIFDLLFLIFDLLVKLGQGIDDVDQLSDSIAEAVHV